MLPVRRSVLVGLRPLIGCGHNPATQHAVAILAMGVGSRRRLPGAVEPGRIPLLACNRRRCLLDIFKSVVEFFCIVELGVVGEDHFAAGGPTA